MKPRGMDPTHAFTIRHAVDHLCCSTAISWTLFALCCQPAVQVKLRAELRTCPTDSPTMEQLNTLPYLEAVVREALRLYAPVSSTQRTAMHDAEIPVQRPYTDKHGVLQRTIRYGYSHMNLCAARERNG
jgi:hypothetical protein